jgi:hypothetical protein
VSIHWRILAHIKWVYLKSPGDGSGLPASDSFTATIESASLYLLPAANGWRRNPRQRQRLPEVDPSFFHGQRHAGTDKLSDYKSHAFRKRVVAMLAKALARAQRAKP